MRCRWTVPQTRSTKIPSPPEVFWETFSAGGQNQPYGTFLPFLKSLGGTGARGRGNCSQRLTRNPFRRWDRTNRMVRFPLSSKAWEGWGCEERKLFPKTYWEPSPPGGRTNLSTFHPFLKSLGGMGARGKGTFFKRFPSPAKTPNSVLSNSFGGYRFCKASKRGFWGSGSTRQTSSKTMVAMSPRVKGGQASWGVEGLPVRTKAAKQSDISRERNSDSL